MGKKRLCAYCRKPVPAGDQVFDERDRGPLCEECDPDKCEVTVWGMEGDIVKKLWEASPFQVDEIEEQYGDDGRYSVQVEYRH